MDYIISYELCAIIFLFMVIMHFFSGYKLPAPQNISFRILLLTVLFFNLLDIITAYTISYSDTVPVILNETLLQIFFLTELALGPLLYIFVLSLTTDNFAKKNKHAIIISFIPYLLSIVIWALNPAFDFLFYFDDNNVYHHGMLIAIMYICGFVYLMLSLAITLFHKRNIQQQQFFTILGISVIMYVSIIIQYLFPRYLLMGPGAALSIMMLYLTLNNPAAMRDELTGCLNRSAFLAFITKRLHRKKPFNSVIVSLDNMSDINKLFGIDAGNDIIFAFTKYIKTIRPDAFTFRLMGDLFVVVTETSGDCLFFKDALMEKMRTPWRFNDLEIQLSATMCYAHDMTPPSAESEILLIIERSIQYAKEKHTGTVFEITQKMADDILHLSDIQIALKETLAKKDLLVYLQPIVSLADGKIVAAEALSRIVHPSLGAVSPEDFIPIAEQNGSIRQLSTQVIESLCLFIKENRLDTDSGLEHIFMNLSVVDLMQKDFAEKTLSCMDAFGVRRGFLGFEMTESTAMLNSEILKSNMRVLCDAGFQFAVDDFGTGYANISALLKLPFTYAKIDRSVTSASLDGGRNQTMLIKLIDLLEALDLKIVIEGVEKKEQHEVLLRTDSELAQGYYYQRPMPMSEFLKTIRP